jgi:hypothetical protein
MCRSLEVTSTLAERDHAELKLISGLHQHRGFESGVMSATAWSLATAWTLATTGMPATAGSPGTVVIPATPETPVIVRISMTETVTKKFEASKKQGRSNSSNSSNSMYAGNSSGRKVSETTARERTGMPLRAGNPWTAWTSACWREMKDLASNQGCPVSTVAWMPTTSWTPAIIGTPEPVVTQATPETLVIERRRKPLKEWKIAKSRVAATAEVSATVCTQEIAVAGFVSGDNSKRMNMNATRGRKSIYGMIVSTLTREERLGPLQNIQYSFKEEGME